LVVDNDISATLLNVVQNDTGNPTASVTCTTSLSINDFRMRPGSNRGDYEVQIGSDPTDDVPNGVLMSYWLFLSPPSSGFLSPSISVLFPFRKLILVFGIFHHASLKPTVSFSIIILPPVFLVHHPIEGQGYRTNLQ
jgi:hypothetical protein